jgi:hypothetical protein
MLGVGGSVLPREMLMGSSQQEPMAAVLLPPMVIYM